MSGTRLGGRRTRNVIAQVTSVHMGDELDASTVERAIDAVTEKVDELLTGGDTYVADLDLVVGANVVTHGLGRVPALVTVIPRTASAAFAWAWDPAQSGNRSPERLTTVDVVGVPMRARVYVS